MFFFFFFFFNGLVRNKHVFLLNDTIASMRLINRMNTIDVAQFDRGLLVAVGPTPNNYYYACYAPVINTSVDLTITV